MIQSNRFRNKEQIRIGVLTSTLKQQWHQPTADAIVCKLIHYSIVPDYQPGDCFSFGFNTIS